MTNPVGYDEDGNPRFKIKDRELEDRYAEHERRVEEDRMKRRWDFGRMYVAAVAWLKKTKGRW